MRRKKVFDRMWLVSLAAMGVLKLNRTKNRCIFKMQPRNTSDQRDLFNFRNMACQLYKVSA